MRIPRPKLVPSVFNQKERNFMKIALFFCTLAGVAGAMLADASESRILSGFEWGFGLSAFVALLAGSIICGIARADI